MVADFPARFITFEGSEGAGKSTQARLLAERLRALGVDVRLTREPGGAPGAEVLRGLLLSGSVEWSLPAETLLHFAARAEHVERTIRPALSAGTWVVCDRFYNSTMAYQGYALGGNSAKIAALSGMLGLRPDLTVILDVEVQTSVERLRARGTAADRYERLGWNFFAAVRRGFWQIQRDKSRRCVLISAEGAIENVAERIWAAMRERIGVPGGAG